MSFRRRCLSSLVFVLPAATTLVSCGGEDTVPACDNAACQPTTQTTDVGPTSPTGPVGPTPSVNPPVGDPTSPAGSTSTSLPTGPSGASGTSGPIPTGPTGAPNTTGTSNSTSTAPNETVPNDTATLDTTTDGPAPSSSEPGDSSGPPAGNGECPSDASFCSGFESPDLPEGAVFKVNGDPATPWTANFEVDSTQKHSGNSSLRVKTASEGVGSYKMLAVPSGGTAFWARFYLRSDQPIGVNQHNAIALASVGDGPNDASVEFAEDVGISFNTQDDVRWPEGYGRLQAGGENPYSLPANEWHCIELSFDGTGRVQKLYIGGQELINATAYPNSAMNFTTFKFGYNALHGTARSLWYDDVVVAASRVSCQ